ncbi:MAG: diguanylate cyclase, partial [Leptospira sp.]|nr:diguanylate cyclase [Leptospira sp.]
NISAINPTGLLRKTENFIRSSKSEKKTDYNPDKPKQSSAGLLEKSENLSRSPEEASNPDGLKKTPDQNPKGLLSKTENFLKNPEEPEISPSTPTVLTEDNDLSPISEEEAKQAKSIADDENVSAVSEEIPEPIDVAADDFPEEELLPDFEHLETGDVFTGWEKEASEESAKTPIRPRTEDPELVKQDFLFDDESDFSTVPVEQHIASKKKIENYLSLFEITKEIATSASLEDLFQNLTYSLMGQAGSESVIIFSSNSGNFDILEIMEVQGAEINPDWNLKTGDEIYNIMESERRVVYAGEILKRNIPEKEKEILRSANIQVLGAICSASKFYGIMMLGPSLNGEEYITDDLEFIKIAGEITGALFHKLEETDQKNREIKELKDVVKSNDLIISLSRKVSASRSIDEVTDLISEILDKELGVLRTTFLLFDDSVNGYNGFSSNLISADRLSKLFIPEKSELIGMVSNIIGVYNIGNFSEMAGLKLIFSNDELGLMKDFIVIPYINLNWLVGMTIIHETSFPWTASNRETVTGIAEIVAPVLANIIILKQKETIFRDPFNPLESRLDSEIKKSNSLRTKFSVIIFKIENPHRVINLLSAEFFVQFADNLRKSIVENTGELDYLVRVGQGKFAVILHGKDKEESETVIKKIKLKAEELQKNPKEFKVSIHTHILTYPVDTTEKLKFFEMIEES